MRSFLAAFALTLLLGNAALPQVRPGGDKAKQAEEREKKAKELYEAALKLEEAGKLEEALKKYQELRDRYLGTRFMFEKLEELNKKLFEIGTKVAVGALKKQKPYRKPHVDHWYGYQFSPPDGWHGVPPMQQYYGDQVTSEIEMKERTNKGLLRVARYTSNFLERVSLEVVKVFAAKDLDDVETRLFEFYDNAYKNLKKDKTEEIRGRIPGRRTNFSTEDGDRIAIYCFYAQKKGLAMIGSWRASGGQVSFRITITTSKGTSVRKSEVKPVPAEDFEAFLKVLDECAKGFMIHPPGRRNAALGAQLSDWNVMKSPRGSYIIQYDTKPEFARRVGKEMEQILMLYKKVIPSRKGIPSCRIKVFDRKMDFHYYGAPMGAAAYWSPSQEEIVCYRFAGRKVKHDSDEHSTVSEGDHPEEVTFHILYHEGFHQYMFYLMGRGRGVYVPSWLNEGVADYFFGGKWETSSRFTVGLNTWRVAKIAEAVKADKHVPLRKLIKYSQANYYTNASLCYAEGWALNYFFLKSDVAKKKRYHLIPSMMIASLLKTGDWEKSTEEIFKPYDIEEIEKDFKAFVLTLPVPEKPKEEEPAEPAEKGGAPKAAVKKDPGTLGLVACFSFDKGEGERAEDSSGKGNHGVLKSGTSWTDGTSGKAVSFDGEDDHIVCGGTDLPAGNAEQTICCWFKPTGNPKNIQCMIDLYGDSGSILQFGYRWKGLAVWSQKKKILLMPPLPSGRWYHLAYTHDGSIHRLYLNGNLVMKSSVTASSSSTTGLVLGRFEEGQRSHFKGDLDGLRIYSRVLDADEIKTLASSE